jgi:hypothetical protein
MVMFRQLNPCGRYTVHIWSLESASSSDTKQNYQVSCFSGYQFCFGRTLLPSRLRSRLSRHILRGFSQQFLKNAGIVDRFFHNSSFKIISYSTLYSYNLRSRKDAVEEGGHNLYTTFQVHTKHSIRDTDNWFTLLQRTTRLVQYISM